MALRSRFWLNRPYGASRGLGRNPADADRPRSRSGYHDETACDSHAQIGSCYRGGVACLCRAGYPGLGRIRCLLLSSGAVGPCGCSVRIDRRGSLCRRQFECRRARRSRQSLGAGCARTSRVAGSVLAGLQHTAEGCGLATGTARGGSASFSLPPAVRCGSARCLCWPVASADWSPSNRGTR